MGLPKNNDDELNKTVVVEKEKKNGLKLNLNDILAELDEPTPVEEVVEESKALTGTHTSV